MCILAVFGMFVDIKKIMYIHVKVWSVYIHKYDFVRYINELKCNPEQNRTREFLRIPTNFVPLLIYFDPVVG